jgi:Sulfatase
MLKSKDDSHLLISAAIASVYFFLAIPLATYSIFNEELSISLQQGILTSAACSLVFFGAIYFVLKLSPEKLSRTISMVLLLVALFSFYNFYFNDYRGKIIGADEDVLNFDYAIWEYILLSCAVIALLWNANRARAYFVKIILILILFSLSGAVNSLITSNVSSRIFDDNIYADEEFYKFSRGKNVIHIVLDGMQGTVFSQILKDHPEIKDQFDGFVFFPDTLTSTEVTYLSIPALLTGNSFDGRGSIHKFQQQAGMIPSEELFNSTSPSLLQHLHKHEFSIEILAAPGGGMEELPFYNRYHYTDFEEGNSSATGYAKLVDLTLIKVLPWSGKRAVYKHGTWFLSASNEGSLPRANRAMLFLEKFGQKSELDDRANSYKLLHILTPHGPYTTGRDCSPVDAAPDREAAYLQAYCTMKAVGQLFAELQRRKVYNRSLIIVNGDHGLAHPFGLEHFSSGAQGLPRRIGNTNPLLLVKQPQSVGPLLISEHPTELADIPATILSTIGIPHDFPGISVLSNDLPLERTRTFFEFEPNRILLAKFDRVDVIRRYEVSGKLWDKNSWSNYTIINQRTDDGTLKTETILSIRNTGVSGNSVWVTWEGQPPAKQVYAKCNEEKMYLTIGETFLSFELPKDCPTENLYLIDPIAGAKQSLLVRVLQ